MAQKELKAMRDANKLLKQNKVVFDPNTNKLVWIYNPELFKALMKATVPSKIRRLK